MRQLFVSRAAIVAWFAVITSGIASVSGQPPATDNELNRFRGHWRITELVDDGRAIPEQQMPQWLPGGGVLEIVDNTILFQSPMDGTKSAKSYRLGPTSYPKRISIFDRDVTTGNGIYKFDQGNLVICVTHQAGELPSEFSAAAGSKRTLMVLQKFEPGKAEIPGLNTHLPRQPPTHSIGNQQLRPPGHAVAARPASSSGGISPTPASQPPPPIVASGATGRILTDTEVREMAIGKWRINDNEGSIDIILNANNTFASYRYYQRVGIFHTVFVPTPISSGNWVIKNGHLQANITASARIRQINQVFMPAVRSISATDMILVNHLGTVSRAIRIP